MTKLGKRKEMEGTQKLPFNFCSQKRVSSVTCHCQHKVETDIGRGIGDGCKAAGVQGIKFNRKLLKCFMYTNRRLCM